MRLGAYAADRRPLAIPAFRRLWTASAVCAVGGSFTAVAVPTQLYTLTGWIERNDRTQASFAVSVPTHTLGSISTGRSSIVVGSNERRKAEITGPTSAARSKAHKCPPPATV